MEDGCATGISQTAQGLGLCCMACTAGSSQAFIFSSSASRKRPDPQNDTHAPIPNFWPCPPLPVRAGRLSSGSREACKIVRDSACLSQGFVETSANSTTSCHHQKSSACCTGQGVQGLLHSCMTAHSVHYLMHECTTSSNVSSLLIRA